MFEDLRGQSRPFLSVTPPLSVVFLPPSATTEIDVSRVLGSFERLKLSYIFFSRFSHVSNFASRGDGNLKLLLLLFFQRMFIRRYAALPGRRGRPLANCICFSIIIFQSPVEIGRSAARLGNISWLELMGGGGICMGGDRKRDMARLFSYSLFFGTRPSIPVTASKAALSRKKKRVTGLKKNQFRASHQGLFP